MSEEESHLQASEEKRQEVAEEVSPIDSLDAGFESVEGQGIGTATEDSETSEKVINKQEDLIQSLDKKAKGKRRKKWLILALVTVLVLLGSGGIYLFSHYSAGDIRGNWGSKQIEDDVKKAYEAYAQEETSLSAKSEFLVGRKVLIKVTEDRIKASVTLTFDKEAYYKAYEENAETLKERLAEHANRLSHINPEANIFAFMEENFTVSREEALASFDEDLKEILPKGAKYDPKTGKVTLPIFIGKVDRMGHTIKLSSVTKSKIFGLGKLPLKKGTKLRFVKIKEGVRMTDAKKKDKLILNK